jgi:hypothetical protein
MLLATRPEASDLLAAELPSSLHYALGPVVAFVVVLALGLLSRWWMAPSRPQQRRREENRARRDFGLLVPVAVRPRRSDAEQLATTLNDEGVRATVVVEPPGPTLVTAAGHVQRQPGGRHQVLVFGKDEPRARQLLGKDA